MEIVWRGKKLPSGMDERERSSGTKEIPAELRGRRLMTHLFLLADDLRAEGREPTVVHLAGADEFVLFSSAGSTFGSAGARAASGTEDEWRAFLRSWFRDVVQMEVVFDAPETRVS